MFLLVDLAYDRAIKSKKSALEELAFLSRRFGISIWIITQKCNSIYKSFRDQLSWLAMFYCKDRHSFKNALFENYVVPENRIDYVNNYLRTMQRAKLIIRNDKHIMYRLK